MIARTPAPIPELSDAWDSAHDRMIERARVLVVASGDDGPRLVELLRRSGTEATHARGFEEARLLMDGTIPAVRVVRLEPGDDALLPLLQAPTGLIGYLSMALVPAGDLPLAIAAMKAGAEESHFADELDDARLRALIHARVREGVLLRLTSRLVQTLWDLFLRDQPAGERAKRKGGIQGRVAAQRKVLQLRGTRVVVCCPDGARGAALAANLRRAGAAIVTASDVQEAREILQMVDADVAVLHTDLVDVTTDVIGTLQQTRNLLQVVLLGESNAVNAALRAGAVSVRPDRVEDADVLVSVVRRLIVARRSLDLLRGFAREILEADPDIVERRQDALPAAVLAHVEPASSGSDDPGDPIVEPSRAPPREPSAEPSGAEKRRDERNDLEFPVTVFPQTPGLDPVGGTTLNLSLSGMFVAGALTIPPDTPVLCQVHVGEETVGIDGKVVRHGRAAGADGVGHDGLGIWFPHVDVQTMRRLSQLLRQAAGAASA